MADHIQFRPVLHAHVALPVRRGGRDSKPLGAGSARDDAAQNRDPIRAAGAGNNSLGSLKPLEAWHSPSGVGAWRPGTVSVLVGSGIYAGIWQAAQTQPAH